MARAIPRLVRSVVAAIALVLAATGTAQAGNLWWTNIESATPWSVGRASLSGAGMVSNFIPASGNPYGLYVSPTQVYWTNVDAGTISRADLDGTDVVPALIQGASRPADVSVDDDGYIYWANSGSNTIGRARIDGSAVNQGFIAGTRSAATVWTDETYIYWGNGSFSGASSIGRANLDGTGVDQDWITGSGVRSPATVVANDAFIYWTNSAGAPTIGRARIDGTGVNGSFVTAGPTGSLPNGLSISGQYLYWTLYTTNALGRAALDGSPVDQSFVNAPSSRAYGPGSVAVSQYRLQVSRSGAGTVTSSPAGLSCGTDCAEAYPEATTVQLTATPADTARFTGWGGACSGLAGCTAFVVAPVTVQATFAALPVNSPVLTVSTSGPGTVTSSPAGIACGTDCRQSFASGAVVTLVPTPAEGAVFTGWQGACSGTGSCTVSMTQARTVAASFATAPAGSPVLSVQLAGTGHGRVTSSPAGIACSTDCSQAFTSGAVVTLTADPSPGSVFTRWSGACSGASPTCAVPMGAARSVTATFVPDNRFTVRKVRVTTRTLQESVRVPGPGRITVVARRTAKGMKGTACSVRRSARRATTLRVSCTLNARTRALRQQVRVRVSVRTTFTPVGGTSRAINRPRTLPRTG